MCECSTLTLSVLTKSKICQHLQSGSAMRRTEVLEVCECLMRRTEVLEVFEFAGS